MRDDTPARVTITVPSERAARALATFVDAISSECRVGVESGEDLSDKEPIPPVIGGRR